MPVLAVAVLSYFAHHATSGSFGLEAQSNYAERIVTLQSELALLQSESAKLKRRTKMLRDGSLDRDMIDEQARRLLGMTRQNEIVILHAGNS
ncbi:FtsB family cell division protein [Oricola sp.]|uniref:FtsB family cell division protein n=1 Tax=Oricola sp. TaxID=1979950 RepID=UPI003BA9A90A